MRWRRPISWLSPLRDLKRSWPTSPSAVKPGGKWAHLVGKKVWRPLHREQIPIIADEAVEEGFGTGVLKVTPAHDKTDYEIGKRHDLPFIEILHRNGKIFDPGEHDAAELHGMDRFDARKRSAELLNERGLLLKEEPYENNVGFSERANVPIEPMLSVQWFLRYPNIPEALALLQKGHVKFHPEHWTKVYEHWLENIQPWCVSRQIWWGHQIPVWYNHPYISNFSSGLNGIEVEPGNPGALRFTYFNLIRQSDSFESAKAMCCSLSCPGPGWEQDPRLPRHLVLVVALGLRDDADRGRHAAEILSDQRACHRTRHYFPLGGANAHRRTPLQAERRKRKTRKKRWRQISPSRTSISPA